MRVGSLFSGIGGIELGFERAGGFEIVWFVEIEPSAEAVLRKQWPNTPIYGNIEDIDWNTMPPVDILTGGFPCQDASIANSKGRGIKGARTGLWKHYLKAIRTLRPRFVIAENVPNLRNRGFEEVIADLASIGYDSEWDTICYQLMVEQGQYFMERERLVTIAYPSGLCRQRRLHEEPPEEQDLQYVALAKKLLARREHELPEPALLGVGTWFPQRVDRTRQLGNSVSPKMSEAIAHAIKASR